MEYTVLSNLRHNGQDFEKGSVISEGVLDSVTIEKLVEDNVIAPVEANSAPSNVEPDGFPAHTEDAPTEPEAPVTADPLVSTDPETTPPTDQVELEAQIKKELADLDSSPAPSDTPPTS